MKMEFTRVMRGKTVFSSQLNSEFLRGKLSLFGYLCVCVCVCTLWPHQWYAKVPGPKVKPAPCQWQCQSLIHWATRELLPILICFVLSNLGFLLYSFPSLKKKKKVSKDNSWAMGEEVWRFWNKLERSRWGKESGRGKRREKPNKSHGRNLCCCVTLPHHTL